ncbi:MAG TPA: permease [Chloroflexi bacterium]|nr:permease [Chloroflexota bacterium]
MDWISTLASLVQTGLGSLAAYLAAHVLLCLLPAFLIAGALAALIPQEAITRYLGRNTPKWISYPAAAAAGFVLAVCSCTIMPLFASIYRKGAGLGPAITFLFVGPAVNILAISLTGVTIGMDIALARIVLSIVFGVTIGLLMAWLFRKADAEHDAETAGIFEGHASVPARTRVFFLLLLGVLFVGTLQVSPLAEPIATVKLGNSDALALAGSSDAPLGRAPLHWSLRLQNWLTRAVPPNPALGIEGISVHGLMLIGLLVAIGATAWRGLGQIEEQLNPWTSITLGLVSITLLLASMRITASPTGLDLSFTGRALGEALLIAALWWLAVTHFETYEIQEWLWEVWRFVKQIIPLLLIGVFVAGMARALIPPTWIQTVAGTNSVWANLAGVLFGVFMYFPTLVEVPIAQTFLSLGMQRGPLLAYLLADPELSLQSILITNTIIGKKKTAVYVLLVTIFSTVSGLIFGWVNAAA